MSGWNKIMSGVAHVLGLCIKCPLFLCCFNENWDERRNFSGCLQYQTSWTPFNGSGVVTCEWLEVRYRHIRRHTDRQTDTEKIPGAVLLHFIATSPRRGPLAYLKTRVCPYDWGKNHMKSVYTLFLLKDLLRRKYVQHFEDKLQNYSPNQLE